MSSVYTRTGRKVDNNLLIIIVLLIGERIFGAKKTKSETLE